MLLYSCAPLHFTPLFSYHFQWKKTEFSSRRSTTHNQGFPTSIKGYGPELEKHKCLWELRSQWVFWLHNLWKAWKKLCLAWWMQRYKSQRLAVWRCEVENQQAALAPLGCSRWCCCSIASIWCKPLTLLFTHHLRPLLNPWNVCISLAISHASVFSKSAFRLILTCPRNYVFFSCYNYSSSL